MARIGDGMGGQAPAPDWMDGDPPGLEEVERRRQCGDGEATTRDRRVRALIARPQVKYYYSINTALAERSGRQTLRW